MSAGGWLSASARLPTSRVSLPRAGAAGRWLSAEPKREDDVASFIVKAAPRPESADQLEFDEKTMWRGKNIRTGDEVFIFAAEHNGGRGLCARGVVTEAVRGEGIRASVKVKRTGTATRPLGRAELRPFRDLADAGPEAEIDHKLYVQATNKIAGVSDAAAAFLRGFFE
jgi:hypothetical protein